ncbi:inositol-3-phosphate synthase [Actinacidiphila acidipaludis]|uniref:Inositol-3-phosphate synthase n=1 Tax=Actinacidiphila acidipaludis TaxID=2873382 RepID=A0ABS7Q8M9_9ACTN|nr:inositol-3-phosphate synthase [Streptomyces acidipaludis]MBY8878790.1 inositol-3-phosphate synthase [Streptomyces acidipaludis]
MTNGPDRSTADGRAVPAAGTGPDAAGTTGHGTVNVGIVGVGNCASSLVQGVEFYRDAPEGTPGLRQAVCAGYAIGDVRFTAAFDVDTGKTGRDLSEAIWAPPNNARAFAAVPRLDVQVTEGALGDGVGRSASGRLDARGDATAEEIAGRLRASGTHVLVNFLPVGSQAASEVYARAALLAGCGFVNCMPAVIARSPQWARAFADAGLPLAGDDLKSQFGATLVHRALMDALQLNGVALHSTYQLLGGGNMDFLNMQDPERMAGKKATKAQGALAGAAPGGPGPRMHVGADFIPFLGDRKVAFIRVQGEAFGGTPVEVDLRMEVDDSPSAAGNVLDAVRHLKAALDQGAGGVVDPVSAELMKAAPAPRDAAPGPQDPAVAPVDA